LLNNYCELNSTAFSKILKKHDKSVGIATKETFLKENIHPLPFYKHLLVRLLIHETEVKIKVRKK
jgi:SPX domain protein involved in polyphosphate accumulation